MKSTAYILVLLEALATLAMGLYPFSGPPSIGDIVFCLWTISPYFFMVWLVKISECGVATAGVFGVCLLVGLFGLVIIFNATVVDPGAQSGIAYFYTPMLQWVALLIGGLRLLHYLNRLKHTP